MTRAEELAELVRCNAPNGIDSRAEAALSKLVADAEALAEALEALANEAARTCTEPRRFHENEEYRQQDLSGAVAHARLTLARYREGKP